MQVRRLLPDRRPVEVADVLASLGGPGGGAPPFAREALDTCAAVSRALLRDPEAKAHPELVALGYWLRRSELSRLEAAFAALETPDTLLVPRGLAFHVPPSNVDTIFVYSWALSFLVGNRNVVRLSSRETAVSGILMRILDGVASAPAGAILPRTTAFVTYGHEREVTDAFSAACDVRLIWGGDASVAAVRASPIPPGALDIAFPDRYSIAVLSAPAVLALGAREGKRLADAFFNDTFWFDQLGCSSPRLVAWVGAPEQARDAARRFEGLLAGRVAAKGYALPTSAALAKLTFAYGAVATQPVVRYATHGNELTLLDLAAAESLSNAHCGGGLLFQVDVGDLSALVPLVTRRYQTVSYFGFSRAELAGWLRELNGRGVDRVVPVGEALSFHRYWDGFDLLQALTRRVHLRAPEGSRIDG
jgi:hypothetical protein